MNLTTILILALLAQGSPAPVAATTPAPAASAAPSDPCADDRGHTALLAAIDRPTLGFSTCAVKLHDMLVELGYGHVTGPGLNAVQYGQGFIRFGVAKNVEADFIGPAYVAQTAPASASGYADSGAGFKWELEQDPLNTVAVDVLYTVPNGGSAFTSGVPTQTFNVDYARSMGNFGLATTLAYVRGSSSAFAPSVVFANQFNASGQWFIEGFATLSQGEWQSGEDVGLQFLLQPSLELDFEGSRTSTPAGPVHNLGFGFGFLF